MSLTGDNNSILALRYPLRKCGSYIPFTPNFNKRGKFLLSSNSNSCNFVCIRFKLIRRLFGQMAESAAPTGFTRLRFGLVFLNSIFPFSSFRLHPSAFTYLALPPRAATMAVSWTVGLIFNEEIPMPFCEICQKGPSTGHKKEQRGKAKYLGGNGRKTTGITKRQWQPNLQRIRVEENGQTVRRRVCVKCIRGGAIRKAVVRHPFTLPT